MSYQLHIMTYQCYIMTYQCYIMTSMLYHVISCHIIVIICHINVIYHQCHIGGISCHQCNIMSYQCHMSYQCYVISYQCYMSYLVILSYVISMLYIISVISMSYHVILMLCQRWLSIPSTLERYWIDEEMDRHSCYGHDEGWINYQFVFQIVVIEPCPLKLFFKHVYSNENNLHNFKDVLSVLLLYF